MYQYFVYNLEFIISVTGEKISPIEVDSVLLTHPDVSQGVAFGVPDEKYGEEVSKNPLLKLLYYHRIIYLRG